MVGEEEEKEEAASLAIAVLCFNYNQAQARQVSLGCSLDWIRIPTLEPNDWKACQVYFLVL